MPQATLESGAQTRVVDEHEHAAAQRPERRRRQDRPHARRRLRARRLGQARRGAAARGRARRAERSPPRRRDRASCSTTGYSLYDREEPVDRRRGGGEHRRPLRGRAAGAGRRRATSSVRVRDDQKVRVDVEAPAEVEGPIAAGEQLGEATVTVDGQVRRPGAAGRRHGRRRADDHRPDRRPAGRRR